MDHLDETGKPCTRHAPASSQKLLALALLGSRMPSFHHDVASKLQSAMMAIEELEEIGGTEVRAAAATANTALREMQALFMSNRTLSRPPQRGPTPLGELIAAAAQRAGIKTHGELPAEHVEVSLSTMTHALAIVLDLAAGSTKLGGSVALAAALEGSHVAVTISSSGEPLGPSAAELLALASFALAREQGELRCGPATFTIRLPRQQ